MIRLFLGAITEFFSLFPVSFLNRLRWAPFTLSAHLTAWGILFAVMGHGVIGGALLAICGVGGGAAVWFDFSLRVTGKPSHIGALFRLVSGEAWLTRTELLGLLTHIPQGIAGGVLLWLALG
jgi:hypothetical protein